MTKPIQAYFRTEDEAETVKAFLIAHDVEALEVSRLEEGYQGRNRFLIPIPVGAGVQSATSIGSVATPIGGLGAAAAFTDADFNDDLNHAELNYVLSGKVADADYKEVIYIIRSNKGHVEIEV